MSYEKLIPYADDNIIISMGNHLSSRVSRQTNRSIMAFIQRIGPTSLKPEKQPRTIGSFPPPYLIVPLVYIGSKHLPLGLL